MAEEEGRNEAASCLHAVAVRSRGLSNRVLVLWTVNPIEFRRNEAGAHLYAFVSAQVMCVVASLYLSAGLCVHGQLPSLLSGVSHHGWLGQERYWGSKGSVSERFELRTRDHIF